MCRLWGIPNDLTAQRLSNLLIVEPGAYCVCDVDFRNTHTKINKRHCGRFFIFGRGDRNRTCDPLHPMQVLYQAELRPDMRIFIQSPPLKCKNIFYACTNRKKVTSMRISIKLKQGDSSDSRHRN